MTTGRRYPVMNLGLSVPRPSAPGSEEPVRRAGFLIFQSDGRILLLRRSSSGRLPGAWDLPGGHVEDGETEWEGALRECREEMGGLPPLRVVGTRVRREGRLSWTTYFAETSGGRWEPRLNPEHDAWGWFAPEGLPAPLRPSVAALLEGLHREWNRRPSVGYNG